MPFYVYIIQSQHHSTFYKGYTEYPALRLREHNEGFSNYTSGKGPWTMIYLEAFEIKRDALIRERKIKKYSRDKIEVLIKSPNNIVSEFPDLS
jgi:putative endonuclease